MTRRHTLRAIFADHGGEMRFWLAWVRDELDADLRAAFRDRASADPGLAEDIASVEAPSAAAEVRATLEVTNYLTSASPPAAATPDPREEMTDLVFKEREDAAPARLRTPPPSRAASALQFSGAVRARTRTPREGQTVHDRVKRALFGLLAEAEVPLPACDEAREATLLLRHLAGREATDHFLALHDGLRQARQRLDLAGRPGNARALDRLLFWLAPECFVTDGRRPHREMSFRLYLRSRLKNYCRSRNWRPTGPRYATLEAAFAALSRERIGRLVREALAACAGVEAAEGAAPEALRLLLTVP